ncbi:MAG: 1-acyl-sn-glycerol-3-phosphate acyltransferase [Actinobacteria bacterium]|nr:1-acyl-sn-glycerol-3-phosphate acyltransferase [Actinomycetota bacterium]
MLYRGLELTVAPMLRATYRPTISGLENVPRTGPVIIAGNHISFADEIFTPLAARRQVCYLAKAEYFYSPGVRGRAMALFFGGLGLVPVDRNATRAAAASVDVCVDVLRQGRAFGIYPEGTRSPDGRLYRFRTGVARIALRSGAPVVPVGLIGTDTVQPPDSKRWHPGRVTVNFGSPLDFSGRAEDERSARKLREITEQIRLAVQALSGQTYVDRYGSTAKAGAVAASDPTG